MWAAVGAVVVLVAAGATYFLVREDGGSDAPRSNNGNVQEGAGCDGGYCIGEYSYVNACATLDPSSVAARIGTIGSGRLDVQEVYADPLPPTDTAPRPSWTFGVASNCYVAPEDRERAAFRSVSLELKQTASEATENSGEGRPLGGVEGAVVKDSDGRAQVYWRHRNVQAALDVGWGKDKPAIPDTTLAQAVDAITKTLANPTAEAKDLGGLSRDGKRIVTDACAIFTGEDFQAATRYVVNPTNVKRTYGNTPGSPVMTSCLRSTASKNSGFPSPEGTTFLDGAMAPTVRVSALNDNAAATTEISRNRGRIDAAVDLPGIGDAAVFGIVSGRFTLQFTSGFHLVTVDCGLSNGNADWTPADMRTRLEPLAKAIAGRMG